MVRKNVKTLFPGNKLQNWGVYYTQVNMVSLIKVKYNANGKTLSFLSNCRTLATQLKQENEIYIPFYFQLALNIFFVK